MTREASALSHVEPSAESNVELAMSRRSCLEVIIWFSEDIDR